MPEGFNTIEEALRDLAAGKVIVCVDDPDRENEGDFICAARYATTENVNLMAIWARGLICTPMSASIAAKLSLPPMVIENTDNHETAFTVSIDHVDTTTGISAEERGYTARKCIDADAKPTDFRRPGHMFPLIAKPGACWSATATRRQPWTCAAWPAWRNADCAAKSCATTAP